MAQGSNDLSTLPLKQFLSAVLSQEEKKKEKKKKDKRTISQTGNL